MRKVILKFPDINAFNKIQQYLILEDCECNEDELTITCNYDPIEVKIATDFFHAVIIES